VSGASISPRERAGCADADAFKQKNEIVVGVKKERGKKSAEDQDDSWSGVRMIRKTPQNLGVFPTGRRPFKPEIPFRPKSRAEEHILNAGKGP